MKSGLYRTIRNQRCYVQGYRHRSKAQYKYICKFRRETQTQFTYNPIDSYSKCLLKCSRPVAAFNAAIILKKEVVRKWLKILRLCGKETIFITADDRLLFVETIYLFP
jgi:hypothetical protein